jgi:hypothetical protein
MCWGRGLFLGSVTLDRLRISRLVGGGRGGGWSLASVRSVFGLRDGMEGEGGKK